MAKQEVYVMGHGNISCFGHLTPESTIYVECEEEDSEFNGAAPDLGWDIDIDTWDQVAKELSCYADCEGVTIVQLEAWE